MEGKGQEWRRKRYTQKVEGSIMVFEGGSCREVRLEAAFDRTPQHEEGILLVTSEKLAMDREGAVETGRGQDLWGRQCPEVEKREA